MSITNQDIESVKFELLIDAVNKRYGYDFSQYSKMSLHRRINDFMRTENINSYYKVIELVIEDELFFNKFLSGVSVNVTEMFRDEYFYKVLREKVIPVLKTYPSIKIWHAGCATGEEAYSLAILFEEEGILDRSVIYATDINHKALEIADSGIYSVDQMKKYTSNYHKAGGQNDFSDYYYAKYNSCIIKHLIRDKICFFQHNLVADKTFNQMNLILCRNVLIYFDRELQNKVLNLFNDSSSYYSFLCLGMKETLSGTSVCNNYSVLDQKAKIYQKVKTS